MKLLLLLLLLLLLPLTSCALGYTKDGTALGLVVGAAQIESCDEPREFLREGDAVLKEGGEDCAVIEGGTASRGITSLIGSIFMGAGRAMGAE